MLDSYKKGYIGLLVLSLAASLEPLVLCPAYVFSIGIVLVDFYLNWLNWFHCLILKGGLLVIQIDSMLVCFNLLVLFSFDFMTRSGCSALHRLNHN